MRLSHFLPLSWKALYLYLQAIIENVSPKQSFNSQMVNRLLNEDNTYICKCLPNEVDIDLYISTLVNISTKISECAEKCCGKYKKKIDKEVLSEIKSEMEIIDKLSHWYAEIKESQVSTVPEEKKCELFHIMANCFNVQEEHFIDVIFSDYKNREAVDVMPPYDNSGEEIDVDEVVTQLRNIFNGINASEDVERDEDIENIDDMIAYSDCIEPPKRLYPEEKHSFSVYFFAVILIGLRRYLLSDSNYDTNYENPIGEPVYINQNTWVNDCYNVRIEEVNRLINDWNKDISAEDIAFLEIIRTNNEAYFHADEGSTSHNNRISRTSAKTTFGFICSSDGINYLKDVHILQQSKEYHRARRLFFKNILKNLGKEQLIKILLLLNKETDFLDHRINQMANIFYETPGSVQNHRNDIAGKLVTIESKICEIMPEDSKLGLELKQGELIKLIEERGQIVSNSAYYSSEVFTKADFLEKINICIDINLEEINYIRGLLFDCAYENCSIGLSEGLSEIQKEMISKGIEWGYISKDGKTVKNKARLIKNLISCGILLDSSQNLNGITKLYKEAKNATEIGDIKADILKLLSWNEIDGLFQDKKQRPLTRENWMNVYNKGDKDKNAIKALIEVYISRKNQS